MITVVDYGIGNLGSVLNMFRKLGIETRRSADPAVIAESQKVLLPGVGAFDRAMRALHDCGMVAALDHVVRERGATILGICLGMQLMTEGSAEGALPGLGWIPGRAERFQLDPQSKLRVPHMGWARIEPAADSALLANLDDHSRFYFVHSFQVVCRDAADVLARACHGAPFTAAFARANVLGVQFHPEKSHRFGMQLLKNFAGM